MPNRIPIKINQTENVCQRDIKKALNLNQVFPDTETKLKPKKRNQIWLVLIAILSTIVLGLTAKIWLDSQKSFSQYQMLIGPETKTAVILKTERLESLVGLAMAEAKKDPDFYLWFKEHISKFLEETQVSWQNDIIPVFNDEAFFLVLPSDKNNFAWVAGARIKAEKDFQARKTIEKIAQVLRQNFGANELLYRQIKINSAYSFNQINKPYYWSQIDNFILVSNNLQSIQTIIDRVIDK